MEDHFHLKSRCPYDPSGYKAKSTQFGWSAYNGGADKQMNAYRDGKAFKLGTWDCEAAETDSKAGIGWLFWTTHISRLVEIMWGRLESKFPKTASSMKTAAGDYSLSGTGFTKV